MSNLNAEQFSTSQPTLVCVSRPAPYVGLLTIDSPPRNAFGRDLTRDFIAGFDELEADPAIGVVVITGTGDSFTAGADLKEQLGVALDDREAYYSSDEQMTYVIKRIAACKLPTIAAVNGYTLGGGLELAITCDIRIASATAKFVCAGVNVGLILSWHKLPRIIGIGRANEMLLSGSMYDAETAERWGLVSSLHAPEDLTSEAIELAERIASRAPLSVQATKAVTARSFEMSAEEAGALQWELFLKMSATSDHREAIRAFVEKRSPNFEAR